MTSIPFRFHLIGNAHLDPVWLWDWREGMNEAIGTTRAMLNLMDESPSLTVVRGETSLYAFLEREAPELFERVCQQIKAGRWEPVGGTYVQSDNNLPSTVALLRQFEVGQAYFQSRFGRTTDTAWFPDSFGHSAGLPEILVASGISNFAHCRPFPAQMPLAEPAYWWEGRSGQRILAYRSPVDWYCCELRSTMNERLDAYLKEAERGKMINLAVFYGLGNHGGGPTRRMLTELDVWKERHPEVEVFHGSLSGYFAALREELSARSELELPVVCGELGFCLRGCYVSTARVKHAYRRAEQAVLRAEKVEALAAIAGASPVAKDVVELQGAWEAVLFNTFHDILAGSSIERACDDHVAQLGGAFDTARRREFAAVNVLAREIDTRVPAVEDDGPSAWPVLVINPHTSRYREFVEFEAQLDWRPIAGYTGNRVGEVPIEVLGPEGNPIPFQRVATENRAMTDLVWRVRLITPVDLPGGAWQVLTVQYRESPRLTSVTDSQVAAPDERTITNGAWTVAATVGETDLRLVREGRGNASTSDYGVGVWLYDDPYGAWGGLYEEPESFHLTKVMERWRITDSRILEEGPLLARLWMRFEGSRSRLDLIATVCDGGHSVRLSGRLFLNERSARVKLVIPGVGGTGAVFEVPGGEIARTGLGEVPGIGWVWGARTPVESGLGFASDVLTGFSLSPEGLTISLARASRYADDVPTATDAEEHLPVVDCGELRFEAVITDGFDILKGEAERLKQPLLTIPVPAAAGRLDRAGALLKVEAPVELLTMRQLTPGLLELTLQNQSDQAVIPTLRWRSPKTATGAPIPPWEIHRRQWKQVNDQTWQEL